MSADGRSRVLDARAAPHAFDAATMRAWVEAGFRTLAAERDRLDALNVFPVPDSDTGTNLFLTFAEGRSALADLPADCSLGELAQAVGEGALMGARGNSGIILSQYLRAFGETFAEESQLEGGLLAWAMDRAAMSASAAMAEPVEGTALTVVAAAADAARRAAYLQRGSDEIPVAAVVTAAAEAAREALARTPALLAPLAERGVVDAGGAGFAMLLRALAEVVSGVPGEPLELRAAPGLRFTGPEVRAVLDECVDRGHALGGSHPGHDLEHYQAGDYEVMYVLSASEEEADRLRDRLGRIGVSVGVVGGVAPGHARGLWHVHVHTDDPVQAVDAARGTRIRQVCVRYLRGGPPAGESLGVVACTRAPGLIAPLASAGAVVVHIDAGDPGIRAGIARAVVDSGRGRVVILPCGPRTAAAAHEVVETLAGSGSPIEVEVLASRGEAAVVAGVAGLASAASATDALDVVAAGIERTRTAVVAWPDGTGPDTADAAMLAEAATAAARDLVRPGDEILTVVAGRNVPADAMEALADAAEAIAPGIEVIELVGGQVSPAFSLGVE